MKKIILSTITLLAASMLMSSCSFDKLVRIDNPTSTQLIVNLDGKEIVLEPFEYRNLEGIKGGKHTITVDGKESTFEITGDPSIMLNPTNETYVKIKQEYGSGMASEEGYLTIVIDGNEYYGPFELIENTLMIDNSDINYDVVTPFSDQIETTKSGTVVMTKIFRKKDFIDFYAQEF